MKLKEFTIGFSRTINLGHYNSAKVEASVTMEVQNGVLSQTLKELAEAQLRDLLEETWKSQHKEPKKVA